MRLELTGRHVPITPTVRTLVEQRLARMTRLLNDSIVSVQVVVTREKTRHHVEITLHARGDHFLHGEGTGPDVPRALSAAAKKVEHQAQKLKSRWTEGKRKGVSAARVGAAAARPERPGRPVVGTAARTAAGEDGDGQVRIIRARRTAMKPMSIEDAALDVGTVDGAFVVFRNAANDSVTVLFRRPDGHIGLIEPDA